MNQIYVFIWATFGGFTYQHYMILRVNDMNFDKKASNFSFSGVTNDTLKALSLQLLALRTIIQCVGPAHAQAMFNVTNVQQLAQHEEDNVKKFLKGFGKGFFTTPETFTEQVRKDFIEKHAHIRTKLGSILSDINYAPDTSSSDTTDTIRRTDETYDNVPLELVYSYTLLRKDTPNTYR